MGRQSVVPRRDLARVLRADGNRRCPRAIRREVRVERADPKAAKGWYVGPGNSDLDVSVGFANEGVEKHHVYRRVTEICLVARGTVVTRVGHEAIELHPGDVPVIEPGEAHTFLSNSSNSLNFAAYVPGLTGIEARGDKGGVARSGIARSRLGTQSPPRSHQTT